MSSRMTHPGLNTIAHLLQNGRKNLPPKAKAKPLQHSAAEPQPKALTTAWRATTKRL